MTGRAARLVVAAAALAWTAALIAFLAPRLPEGLGAACAPELVARELLAGLAVAALLVAPAFVADDPGRRPEDHTALLVVLPGLPAALALHAAGGGAPADLLPALALLLACDLAASSYLRLDPLGKRGVAFSAAAAALLAGIPVGAYGLAEFSGWKGAEAGFRISPILAIRDVSGGWAAVAPAALLLVAAAAVLRLGRVLVRPAAATAALLLVAALAGAAEEPGPKVLVVGAPREGPAAGWVRQFRERGAGVEEVDALPPSLPWSVEVLVFARPPRSDAERREWDRELARFGAAGGRGLHCWSPDLRIATGAFEDPQEWEMRSVDRAGELLASRVAVPHPADRPEPGVDPALHRVPFPVPPRSLPGTTLAFLFVVAAASAGSALLARRRGPGRFKTLFALGGVSAVGSSMLFLPGVLGDPFRVERLVVEERAPGGSSARRVELVRVERLRPGGADPVVGTEPGVSWAEIRYAADSGPAWGADGTVRLAAPKRYALLAGVSGVDTPLPEGPLLATVDVHGGRDAAPQLAALARSEDPRVARAGALLAATFRPRADRGYRLVVPAAGPDAVVLHLAR